MVSRIGEHYSSTKHLSFQWSAGSAMGIVSYLARAALYTLPVSQGTTSFCEADWPALRCASPLMQPTANCNGLLPRGFSRFRNS